MGAEQTMRYAHLRVLDADGWRALLALEAQLELTSMDRARAVFEPRPEHAAPLDALEGGPALRPLEEWADEVSVVSIQPRQSLASFAESTRLGLRED